MDQLKIGSQSYILRENEKVKFKEYMKQFEENRNNLLVKRGIYVYGEPGTGKTSFVTETLKEMNYDIVNYDAGDVRNKTIIETITQHNMSDRNIMSMFQGKAKQIAIVMDEIDGMNNGDKGGINTLIKLIRPKKTKKQKLEEHTINPIICIGNYHVDKKIKELMKVCNVIDLKPPTNIQMKTLIKKSMPTLNDSIRSQVQDFVEKDLRKFQNILSIYKNNSTLLENPNIYDIFQNKSYNDDTKKITQKLINEKMGINDHLTIMNETDRTIVGLLWHENVVDVLGKHTKDISIPFYLKALDNICFADYIDRITFQKQIWQFNEMSSLIKTFKNNHLYHSVFPNPPKYNPSEVRFTKVLTKYSTEYNNATFIQNLCQQLSMDQKDMFAFFLTIKNTKTDAELATLFENYDIGKLDINRIYRYIEKYGDEEGDLKEDVAIDPLEE